jgi:hypothetical protein
MLNYFQRLESYKQSHYFQINGKFLDIYNNQLHLWFQNLDVVKDVLTFASESKLADDKEILYIRFFGTMEPTAEVKMAFKEMLNQANLLLAKTLGASKTWNEIKPLPNLPERHFTTIVTVRKEQKETKKEQSSLTEFTEEIHNDREDEQGSRRKSRAVRIPPDNSESV